MATARSRSRTPKKDWQAQFLREFAKSGLVIEAAKAVGKSRSTVYAERQRNEPFALKWAEIEEWTTEEMEQEARRRAVAGVEEPVFYKGELQGHVRKYSDTLLIFMLKSRRPEVYRDNVRIEHGGQITHKVSEQITGEIDSLMERLAGRSEAAAAGAAEG